MNEAYRLLVHVEQSLILELTLCVYKWANGIGCARKPGFLLYFLEMVFKSLEMVFKISTEKNLKEVCYKV